MVVFIQRIVHNPRQKLANGSLFQQKTVCSLSFMTGSTNGSLSQQKTVCFPSSQQMAVSFNRRQFAHFPSPEVSKWQSLSAEDSLLTFSQQGLQMAVSPSRRQFVPLSDWQMAVFSQEKTVCLLNTQRD